MNQQTLEFVDVIIDTNGSHTWQSIAYPHCIMKMSVMRRDGLSHVDNFFFFF